MSKVTMRHVAEKAGVSSATVSRALNGQAGLSGSVRRHILQVAEQLGYDRVQLRGTTTRRLLFILDQGHPNGLSHTYYRQVLHGAQVCCSEQQAILSLLMLSVNDDVPSLVQRQDAERLLCVGPFESGLLARLQTLSLPMVVADPERLVLRATASVQSSEPVAQTPATAVTVQPPDANLCLNELPGQGEPFPGLQRIDLASLGLTPANDLGLIKERMGYLASQMLLGVRGDPSKLVSAIGPAPVDRTKMSSPKNVRA